VNEIINTKLEEGVAKHGFSFLYEYGSPIAHKNAIGLYAGKPHPVTYGATNRFGRVFQFMASKSIQNKEYRDAIRLIAPIADHYRNYFTGRHDLMSRDSDALPDGLNYDMLKFPKFQQTLQSGFDNFASLRWKKATGAEDPFQIMNDDLLNFYGEIFTLAGKSEQFELYRKQLSHVNASLMNNDIINPFNYLHMLNNLEAEVHKFVGENFSAGIDPKGKLTTSDKMKSNPMWILLGGDKHVKGFSMHPKYRASAKKLRMQREMSQQANLINKTKPGEGKMKEFEEIIKICRGNK
jgi:hypothetical protein